jgi:hypothetical protein
MTPKAKTAIPIFSNKRHIIFPNIVSAVGCALTIGIKTIRIIPERRHFFANVSISFHLLEICGLIFKDSLMRYPIIIAMNA